MNVAGGTANVASTLAACQAACLASPTCVSIDFTAGAVAGQQCWLATITGPTGSFTGNNHYDLTRSAASCSMYFDANNTTPFTPYLSKRIECQIICKRKFWKSVTF